MGRRPKDKILVADENPQISLLPEYDWQFVDNAKGRVKLAWQMHQQLGSGKPMLLAFSGGKDSVCVWGICKQVAEELGNNFDDMFFMQYNITNVDPPELVQFVKKEFPQVNLHFPKKTMWDLIIDKHLPPLRNARYCCAELKEISRVENGFTLTGVRHAESVKRATRGGIELLGKTLKDRVLLDDNDESRRQIEHCLQKQSYVCNPLIDWSDEQVWQFIKKYKLPYCCLYDEGWQRLGCIGCPLASDEERSREFERFPKYKKQYIRTFQKMLDLERGGEKWFRPEKQSSAPFLDGQDVFDWWMHDPAFNERHQSELSDKKNTLFEELENKNDKSIQY